MPAPDEAFAVIPKNMTVITVRAMMRFIGSSFVEVPETQSGMYGAELVGRIWERIARASALIGEDLAAERRANGLSKLSPELWCGNSTFVQDLAFLIREQAA